MIKASLEEALSMFRKWLGDKARLRFVASLKSIGMSCDCSVISVSATKIGLSLPGQTVGVCSIELVGCEFFFGVDDIPSSEIGLPGLQLGSGISLITSDGQSLWLIEAL